MGLTDTILHCDMVKGCKDPIAYIDHKGYIYCATHGKDRQSGSRCRKLTPAELTRLQATGSIVRY
jgi:hypothetical protein